MRPPDSALRILLAALANCKGPEGRSVHHKRCRRCCRIANCNSLLSTSYGNVTDYILDHIVWCRKFATEPFILSPRLRFASEARHVPLLGGYRSLFCGKKKVRWEQPSEEVLVPHAAFAIKKKTAALKNIRSPGRSRQQTEKSGAREGNASAMSVKIGYPSLMTDVVRRR